MSIYYPIYTTYLVAIMSLVFLSRKKPLQRFSWILVLMLVPILGLVLYLFLGSTSFLEYRKNKILKKNGDILNSLEQICNIGTSGLSGHAFLEQYCGSNFTADNDVKVFTDGSSKFEQLFNDFKQAEDNIHVQYFSINNDEVGRELLSILINKAQAGLEVKLLYDTVGCLTGWIHPLFKELRKAGGQVLSIRPLAVDINYRNHRKIVVIDGKIGYTGGMNIGANYKHGVGDKPWRDTHLRITGGAVRYLQKVFLSDWITSARKQGIGLKNELMHYFPEPKSKGKLGTQIIANGLYNKYSNNDIINFSYFHLISRAKKRVWIQTPYFAPSEIILQTLKALASTGVDVRIMTSSSFAFGGLFHGSITNYFLRFLVDSGVKVFKYKGVLHAKTMLIDDDTVCIGTVNLNARSLGIDDEIYAYFESPDFVTNYRSILINDFKHCIELDYVQFQKQRFTSRAFESVMSFFSSVS